MSEKLYRDRVESDKSDKTEEVISKWQIVLENLLMKKNSNIVEKYLDEKIERANKV